MDYGIKLMKKMNNKYRNNNNQIYSLNYKFDSTSIAGKISGTALDLIKKYNELAKEASTATATMSRWKFSASMPNIIAKSLPKSTRRKIRTRTVLKEKRFENQEEAGAPVCNDNAETGENAGNVVERCRLPKLLFSPPLRREFKVIEISSAEANAAVCRSGENGAVTGAEQLPKPSGHPPPQEGCRCRSLN